MINSISSSLNYFTLGANSVFQTTTPPAISTSIPSDNSNESPEVSSIDGVSENSLNDQSNQSNDTQETGDSNSRIDTQAISESQIVAELSAYEQEVLRELKTRDREVRAHEQAHLAAAGSYAIGVPTYTYQEGPDGKQYAVGGEVQIDTSPIPDDPEKTKQKAEQIRRAALAPAQPSGQDRRIAAQATQLELQADIEIRELELEERETQETEAPENQQVTSASDSTPEPIQESEISSQEANPTTIESNVDSRPDELPSIDNRDEPFSTINASDDAPEITRVNIDETIEPSEIIELSGVDDIFEPTETPSEASNSIQPKVSLIDLTYRQPIVDIGFNRIV